jgi:3-phosphoshikimate 1-carboxyvinyltransferase
MALPDLIEIVPLAKPVRAEVTVPGSKSITNRALILAALAEGETTLSGALWSEDTQVMVDCLRELGFMLEVAPDRTENCNRRLTIYGRGGLVMPGGTEKQPLELFVGNAGTAARFLSAFLCLGKGVYRLEGVARMHQRPQAALFDALRELGYRIDSANNKLPAVIHGAGPQPGRCRVSITESSQFASALLLGARHGQWDVEIVGENADESPYVTMTEKLLKVFPRLGGKFQIEPDASSGSYFAAAQHPVTVLEFSEQLGMEVPTTYFDPVKVRDWPSSGWQVDENFAEILQRVQGWRALEMLQPRPGLTMACKDRFGGKQVLRDLPGSLGTPWTISRQRDLGDSIMTAIVIAPFWGQTTSFTDLGRLRVQECERVLALRTELTKCGAKVVESDDALEVFPSKLHGAEIETYNDHRMAMCFAILGLKVPGIKIKNPACVKKTFPNFFQKLAALPPGGLGAEIRDASTGTSLALAELFAE